MIYLLAGMFDSLGMLARHTYEQVTGQWWFATQEPANLEPVPAVIEEDDDDEPFPESTSEGRTPCINCGDPNFSLVSEYCIACRVGFR